MNTEELEAAVRVAWDREAIAVYADHLQAIGDLRGELVAIDLRIDEGNVDAAITARREQLIAEWFGAELPPGIVHYGFVDVRATCAPTRSSRSRCVDPVRSTCAPSSSPVRTRSSCRRWSSSSPSRGPG